MTFQRHDNRATIQGGGFTLIELLVVVSIISLLASIIITATSVAKAKGNDAATISQVNEIKSAFQQTTVSSPYPTPAAAATYYCIGQASCTFWGTALSSDSTVQAGIGAGGLSGRLPSQSVIIDGQQYNGYTYACKTIDSNGVCTAAIYWAQSNYTPCAANVETVYSGVGGYVCGENADGTGIDNVIPGGDVGGDLGGGLGPVCGVLNGVVVCLP